MKCYREIAGDDARAIWRVKGWNTIHSLILLLSSLEVLYLRTTLFLSCTGLLSFSWFLASNDGMLKSSRGSANHANRITFLRLCLTLLLGLLFPLMGDALIAVIALVIIIMDRLDGYLARRFNSISEKGAHFDRETDAFFVCILCAVIYLKGYLDVWILLVGFMRYLYAVLLFLLNLSHRKDPSSRFAQIVAGILFCTLITPFVLPEYVYSPCVIFSSILLIVSFSHTFMNTIFSRE